MLTDPDPPVRAAAAESLGALGTPGQIPALAQRIGDPDPDVAAAAVRGLAALAIRLGRPELARDQLGRVGAGRPDPVAAALAEVRALLGG
jgi:HEAT repeat protein